MSQRKRNISSVCVIALLVAMAVCFAVLFTGYFLGRGYDHNCMSDSCGICCMVKLLNSGTDMLLLACVGTCSALAARVICGTGTHEASAHAESNPVLMRVKLLN